MTTARFYQIQLNDRQGVTRRLAIDLVDGKTPRDAAGLAAFIREVAAAVRAVDSSAGARATYVEAPAPDATLRAMWTYAWGDGAPNTQRLDRHLESICEGRNPHHFILRPGSWAEGADLIGREDVLSALASKLSADGRVHLMAPRRYGKTSIVRALDALLTRSGRTAIRIDVESIDSLVGLAIRLVDEAFRTTDALRSLDELRGWPSANAGMLARNDACEALGRRIASNVPGFLERVCTQLGTISAILLVDEFTRFVLETIAREPRSAFLRALRAIASTPGLALVVCGSQGLRGFVDWHDIQPLRGLESVALGPLDPTVAAVLVEELFYGDGNAPLPDAVQAVLDAVGAPIPYFLHGLVHHTLQEHRSRQGRAIDRPTVQRAYELRLLDEQGNEFWRSFRLKERGYPDVLRSPAAAILRLLSRAVEPVAADALRQVCGALSDEDFEKLLAALAEDYDIVRGDDGVYFRSKAMRERWARREAWTRSGGDAA